MILPFSEDFLPQQGMPQACVQGDWKFNGKTYQGCDIPKGTKEELGQKNKWCPTQLSAEGAYENGSGNYRFRKSKGNYD